MESFVGKHFLSKNARVIKSPGYINLNVRLNEILRHLRPSGLNSSNQKPTTNINSIILFRLLLRIECVL